MTIIDLLLIAVGLSMDAFAVSIGKGLSVKSLRPVHSLIVSCWFGGFQALMPIIGYFLGVSFAGFVESVDHWIAFVLLAFIGGNMIKEALSGEEECECTDSSLAPRVMLTMAVATSIDALAAGVGMSVDLNGITQILFATLSIGLITFALSALGVKIGNVFGSRYKFLAELSGGIVLVGMGIKILLEHLEVFG